VVIKCTQLTVVIRAAPQFWEWGYKTMLRAKPAEFFLFLSFTCDILGYVSRKWCKNSPFYLLRIFSGGTGATMFLRAGPKIEWAGAERERNVKKYGGAGAERWAGVYSVSGERKFRPLPLRSHALGADATGSSTDVDRPVDWSWSHRLWKILTQYRLLIVFKSRIKTSLF